MSDWEDVDNSEWEDVPSSAGVLDYLGAAGQRAYSNLLDTSAGVQFALGDAAQGISDYTGLPLGGLADMLRTRGTESKDLSTELNQDIDETLPDGLGKRIVDVAGGALPAVAALPLGPLVAASTIGAQSAGRKYSALRNPEGPQASGLAAAASALGSGGVDAATSAIPLGFVGTSTGPLLRRWLLESAKIGAGNAAITPLQVAGNAAVDAATLGQPIDAMELGAQTRRGVEDSFISAPVWGLMGATAGSRRAPQQDVPVYSADDMLSQMATDSPPPPPQPDAPTLGLPDSPNQVAGLLPYDRSWVPESYQPGQDFLFRDYAALPPMDISQPQPALSVAPPDPLSWQFRQLEPGDQVFTPDQPLQIGFDGFPQSEMPSWELSPNYNRGDGFQYRDYAALPPMDVSQPQRALSSIPPEPLNWQFRQMEPDGQTLTREAPLQIGFDGTPPVLLDPQAPALQKEVARSVSKSKASVQVEPAQRVDEATSFPDVLKAPESQSTSPQPDLFSQPIVEDAAPNLTPSFAVEGLPVVEVPVRSLRLSAEVPQFKGGADDRGVVEPLQGNFDRRGLAPLQVWERADGSLEVISGRHRLDLAQRTGQETVPVQIYREADGFSARDAAILDAELNIRDENGSIQDYANYFRSSGIDQATAEARGLLSRSKGILGYNIGAKSTPDLFSLYQSGKLTDRQAALIADAAPNNAAIQQVGIRSALKGHSLDDIRNQLGDLESEYRKLPPSAQGDMFLDDRAVRISEARARVATELQRNISEDLASIRGAAKRPARAAKLGVDVNDPQAVSRKAQELSIEQQKLDKYWLYPELKAKVNQLAEQDLKTGNGERKRTAQRIANKRQSAVTSSEAGFLDLSWLSDLINKRKTQKDLPDYRDVSDTNKAYDGVWRSTIEWMDTTKRKAPQSAGFIDAYWKIPQDLNSIVYDAKLTLEPYLGLSAQERKPVDSYLAAARIMGARNPNYKVTPQTAAQMGLNAKQAQAAVSVSKWSNEMLNILEDHAVRVAEHDAIKKGGSLSAEKLQEINTRFNELRDSNYVPFNRYGEHYVNVFDKNGKLAYRYQFEKKSDPELAKTVNHFKQLISQQGNEVSGGKVQYGKADPTQLNERDGVPSDVLEILNDDGAQGEARGFYKHLKPAALVKGFNPDMLKNISEYTTGAAKLISLQRAKIAGERELLAQGPGSLRGPDNINLVRKLTTWAEGFNQKTSPAFQALNNAFNVAYIGGNLRTPTADMLGRIQLQYPLMSKYLKGLQPESVYAKGIGKEVKWWFSSDQSFAKSEPNLAAAIKEAQRKGVIPTNIYKTFLRNARGESSGASAFKNKVHDLYFGLKEISERSTDLGGFILGWEMYPKYMAGKGKGKDARTRQQFAEDFARESRAVPSQAELPALFKSNTARLVTKYRLYQAKILKSLTQAGLGQWARYLAATGFTTGLAGIPFMRDAFNAARFGGVEPEDKIREAGFGPATMFGPMSALAGIDFSGSAGFGEVFPGSGGNMASKFLLGMTGAPFEAMTRSYNYFERGQDNKAIGALPFMPNAISNFLTQKDWGERGVMTLGGKAVIPRDEVTNIDRFKKLLGYQPLRVKEAMVLENRKKQAANTGRATGFYPQRIGEALALGNLEEARALAQQAQEEGVKLNSNSIKDYVAKAQGRDAKIPKKARGEVRRVEELYGNALRD